MKRCVCILLCLTTLALAWPVPVPAQTAAAPGDSTAAASQDVQQQLATARELLKAGDYDRAIELLRGTLEASQGDTAALEDSYLMLVKTYVFLGNDLKFKPQGRMASSLNYKEAKGLIAECLSLPSMHDLKPEPADEYPPEMHELFDEVRREIFGAFRVVRLDPEGAVVVLDADTLQVLPGETFRGETNLPIGAHKVLVRHEGCEDLVDDITISPNAILERSYVLEKKRGKGWYAAWIGGAAVAAGGVAALIAAGASTGDEPAPQPLPGPPGPPAR
jgi:hypothetical protein